MVQPVSDLMTAHGFRTGVLVGVVVAFLLVGAALLRDRMMPATADFTRELCVAAASVCLGGLLAMRVADVPVPRWSWLVSGLGVLFLAEVVCERRPFVVRSLVALPGALLVAASLEGDVPRATALVTVLAGSAAIAEWPQWDAVQSVGPVMLAITIFGTYVTTPDTEHTVVVLGVALAVGVTGWPIRATRVGGAGGAAFVGLVAWLAATDGAARPGAVVGASACVGAFVFPPFLRWLGTFAQRARPRTAPVALTVLGTHCVVVALCSRVAGLEQSALAALVVVGITMGVACLSLHYILRL